MNESTNWPNIPAENSFYPIDFTGKDTGRESDSVFTYVFIIMIFLTAAISFFVLLDQWLYQSQYERLTDLWSSGRRLQVQLDREDRRMINAAVGGGDQALANSESVRLERRIEKLRSELDNTAVSRRYHRLNRLRGDLNEYLRDADRLVHMRRQAQRRTAGIEKESALKVRVVNLRLYGEEERLADAIISAAPRNRPPLTVLIAPAALSHER